MITTHSLERIIKAFDFDRVQKAMHSVDWTYGSDEPVTVRELKDMVWTLFEGFPNWNTNERCATNSGGFTIRKAHGAKFITLSFCIEERDSRNGMVDFEDGEDA